MDKVISKTKGNSTKIITKSTPLKSSDKEFVKTVLLKIGSSLSDLNFVWPDELRNDFEKANKILGK